MDRTPEIEDQQTTFWFEHTGNFSESLHLEVIGQLMHHHAAQHHIKRLVRKSELLYHPWLKVDREAASCRFAAGSGEQRSRRVNAEHTTLRANALFGDHCQRSGAASHIQ